ncbi:MAG: STAS domain-containing protein [Rhodospirillaceae bacterium]
MGEFVAAGSGLGPGAEAERDGDLMLSGSLTINEAETVRDKLAQGLAGVRRLTLDTAGLDAVDVAGLQLLIATRRSAELSGRTVRLAAVPGGALLAALVAAGFCGAGDVVRPEVGQDGFWWGRG